MGRRDQGREELRRLASKSNVPAVVSYITDQEEHYQKISFQDELRQFLQKHGMPYDE